jgi:hypothetical protein
MTFMLRAVSKILKKELLSILIREHALRCAFFVDFFCYFLDCFQLLVFSLNFVLSELTAFESDTGFSEYLTLISSALHGIETTL